MQGKWWTLIAVSVATFMLLLDIAYLEARHRGHARVEDRIRTGKDTGMAKLPFHAFAMNAVWLEISLIA